MSLETVSGHVVIPQLPFWNTGAPTLSRRWQTGIAQGITGSEDRQANASTPWLGISYTVQAMSVEDSQDMVARQRAAMVSGRAAVPLWGFGCELTANASGTSVSVGPCAWDWQVGDWVYFWQDGAWRHRQVSAKAGSRAAGFTLTLGATLDRTFTSGEFVWPLLFGRASFEGVSLRTDGHATVRVSVEQPSGLGDYQVPACPAPVCVESTGIANVCPGPELTVSGEMGCPVQRELRWTMPEGSAFPQVWRADAATGPWTEITGDLTIDVDMEGVHTALIQLPYYRGEATTTLYYSVTAQIAGQTMRSQVYGLAKNRIERLMRAIQERRDTGLTSEIIGSEALDFSIKWPSRTYPGVAVAAAYPGNGWYDVELQTWDTANAQPAGTRFAQLLNRCREAFLWGTGTVGGLVGAYDWLVRFSSFDAFGAYENNDEYHAILYSNDPSPPAEFISINVPLDTTTVALTQTHLDWCQDTICLLYVHYLQNLETGSREERLGVSGFAEEDCAAAEEGALLSWGNDVWAGIGATYLCHYVTDSLDENDPPEDPKLNQRTQVCRRGGETFDLIRIVRGDTKLFAMFTRSPDTSVEPLGGFSDTAPGKHGGPHGVLAWKKCDQLNESPLPGVLWSTLTYGDARDYGNPLACQTVTPSYETQGWFCRAMAVVVIRSPDVKYAGTGLGFDHYA